MDESGDGQVFISKDEQAELQKFFQDYADLGDFVGVEGEVFQTQKGDWAVRVNSAELIAKALRQPPFPRIYYKNGERKVVGGLTNKEIRYRQRYVDLFVNKDAREVLKKRMTVTRAIREFLDGVDYLEVETPTLVTEATGATARPFNTFHNAEKLDMHLRISLELPLKRLIVGGIEKVYEIGRVFRNEGVDSGSQPGVHAFRAIRSLYEPRRHDGHRRENVPAHLQPGHGRRRPHAGRRHGAGTSASPGDGFR